MAVFAGCFNVNVSSIKVVGAPKTIVGEQRSPPQSQRLHLCSWLRDPVSYVFCFFCGLSLWRHVANHSNQNIAGATLSVPWVQHLPDFLHVRAHHHDCESSRLTHVLWVCHL